MYLFTVASGEKPVPVGRCVLGVWRGRWTECKEVREAGAVKCQVMSHGGL